MPDCSVCLCCSSSTNQPRSKCIEVVCLGDAGYLPASCSGRVKGASESSPCRLSERALTPVDTEHSWTGSGCRPDTFRTDECCSDRQLSAGVSQIILICVTLVLPGPKTVLFSSFKKNIIMMGTILLIAPLFVWIYEHDLRFNRHYCEYICK